MPRPKIKRKVPLVVKTFGWWAVVSLGIVVLSVLWSDLARWENPGPEKNFVEMGHFHDFSGPFVGACGLLHGLNPYAGWNQGSTTPPRFTASGWTVGQVYPPLHLLLYVPLAYFSNEDAEIAGRAWFKINLLSLLGLALIVTSLSRSILNRSPRTKGAQLRSSFAIGPWLATTFLLTLSLNPITGFGLERGQSDFFSALLSWSAVWLALAGSSGGAMVAAAGAAGIKGYGCLLLLGLIFFFWNRTVRYWAAALIVLGLATLWRYPSAFWAIAFRASSTRGRGSDNHSFSSLAYFFTPRYADLCHWVLMGGAGLITVLVARRAWRERALDTGNFELWFCLFSSCALLFVTSFSGSSYDYNLILTLPGILIGVLMQERLVTHQMPRLKNLVGLSLLLSCLSLLLFRTADGSVLMPYAGIGGLIYLVTIGALAVCPPFFASTRPAGA